MLISQTSHCALIIVIELSANHETSGVLLQQITDDTVCLFLTRDPQEIFAYEIIQIFDSEQFAGKFLDENTGKWYPESRATKLINFERKQYFNYLRRKLKHPLVRDFGATTRHLLLAANTLCKVI